MPATSPMLHLVDAFAYAPGKPFRVMPLGSFKRGERTIEVTEADLQQMAANYEAGRPRWSIPIYFGHAPAQADGPKHGNVRRLFVVPGDGLYAEPEYTPEGEQAVAAGGYQYVSPGVLWAKNGSAYADEQGQRHDNVIDHVALTNRPFFGGRTALFSAEAAEALGLGDEDLPEVYHLPGKHNQSAHAGGTGGGRATAAASGGGKVEKETEINTPAGIVRVGDYVLVHRGGGVGGGVNSGGQVTGIVNGKVKFKGYVSGTADPSEIREKKPRNWQKMEQAPLDGDDGKPSPNTIARMGYLGTADRIMTGEKQVAGVVARGADDKFYSYTGGSQGTVYEVRNFTPATTPSPAGRLLSAADNNSADGDPDDESTPDAFHLGGQHSQAAHAGKGGRGSKNAAAATSPTVKAELDMAEAMGAAARRGGRPAVPAQDKAFNDHLKARVSAQAVAANGPEATPEQAKLVDVLDAWSKGWHTEHQRITNAELKEQGIFMADHLPVETFGHDEDDGPPPAAMALKAVLCVSELALAAGEDAQLRQSYAAALDLLRGALATEVGKATAPAAMPTQNYSAGEAVDALLASGATGPGAEPFKEFTAAERKALAESGAAMPDGSYPIENGFDLSNAIKAFGRAGENKAEVRAHILKRAKALKLEKFLPDKWKEDTMSNPTNPSPTDAFAVTAEEFAALKAQADKATQIEALAAELQGKVDKFAAEAAAEKRARRLSELKAETAEHFAALAVTPDEFTARLYELETTVTPELYAYLTGILKHAATLVKEGELFAQRGSDKPAPNSAPVFTTLVENVLRDEFGSDPTKYEMAFRKAAALKPDLYADYISQSA